MPRQLHKSFSGASLQALDLAVNAFIGYQTVDSRQVERRVLHYQTYLSAATYYTHIVYEEVALSN